MTKLIAPEYLKEYLFHDAAQSGLNTQGLETVSLSRLFGASEEDSTPVLCLKLMKKLCSEKEKYPEYSRMFSFPSFYEEVISFTRSLALWKIDADALPAEDEAEEQLKDIVKAALTLDLPEKKTAERAETVIAETSEEKGIQIVKSFESDYFNDRMRRCLRESGIPEITVAQAVPASVSRKNALSVRMEIEGCAQQICRNEQPCNIVLCAPDRQMPVLAQVFERYRIPYSYTNRKVSAAIGTCLRTLAEFSVSPDSQHLLNAIDAGAFPHRCEENVLDFLSQVLEGINAPDKADAYRLAYSRAESEKPDPDKKLGRDPVSVYAEAEETAKDYFELIQEYIDQLSSCEDPKQKLIRSYEIIAVSPLLANPDEMAAGRSILSTLQDCIDLIETDEDVLFFCRMCGNPSVSSHRLVTDFCTVTDLQHPVPAKENTYVLGCSGSDYPGFSAMSGLFDEQYVRRIEGFPSLDERQNSYLRQLDWIENSCRNELIYSCFTNDYQGRQQIPAFEIEDIKPDTRWEVVSYDLKRQNIHGINHETAENLFLRKDGEQPYIRGSISGIENWFRCPYRYFFSNGLYVRRPRKPDLSADSVGTWQHAVMERSIIGPDGKPDPDYASKLTAETIDELLSPYFDALLIASPGDAARIQLSKERMIRSLEKAAAFLAEFENSTTFVPEASEVSFYNFPVSEHVRLNGTIDRINTDHANHMIEIMDYKSSTQTLSEASVKSGQQLQLVTYLAAALDLYEKKEEEVIPAGTYYYSLKTDDITDKKVIKAASVARNNWKLTETDFRSENSSDAKDARRKSRNLKGWTFTGRTDAIDRDGEYVAGLNKKYIYDEVRACLYEIYEYFYNRLLGTEADAQPCIDVQPVGTNACQWCDYHDICRYHGETVTAKPIFEGPLAEKKEKSK